MSDHPSEAIPARADVVVENDGTLADLHRMVDAVIGGAAAGGSVRPVRAAAETL